MTKLSFLFSLREKLSALPTEEAEERLRSYSEMIEDRMEEGLSEEEAELLESERMLEAAKKEAERDVAFTSMYFVHIYKAFWRESVSISENIDEIRADLDEFITVLTEKANGADAENEG